LNILKQETMAMKAIKLGKKDEALVASLDYDRTSSAKETVINPFSRQSCELEPLGVALYDYVIGAEALGLHDNKCKAINVFRKLYPDEYYTLLD